MRLTRWRYPEVRRRVSIATEKIAIAEAQPENNMDRRGVMSKPSAFLRPDGRNPYLRALPLQMTFGTKVNFFLKGN